MPLLSVIIPTRDRARYLRASIATALQRNDVPMEVLVLDNASEDDTSAVVADIIDPRVRYARSDMRLSMRDNFERGLDLARGDYLAFIGDDDGMLAHAPETAFRIFEQPQIMALSATRAHYFWPDLISNRRSTGLLPRGSGWLEKNSRAELGTLLADSDYYRLPCLYHGFVRRELVERARRGRFFHSCQVDIYSAIALSMEDVAFAFSHFPLVINGGSSRSNGASHFGGGTEEEKVRFKQEDDLGFLAGFEPHATVASLIVESALRYAAMFGVALSDIFPREAIDAAMAGERAARIVLGLSVDGFDQAEALAGCTSNATASRSGNGDRFVRLVRSFGRMMPVDAAERGASDVMAMAQIYRHLLDKGWRRSLDRPLEQMKVSWRIAQG